MKQVKVCDVADIENGYAFDSEGFNQCGEGLPIVRIRDVVRGYSETFYSGEYPAHYVIDTGDLLIGMDGEFNIRFWQSGKALLNQRVCKIAAKPGKADNTYLRYRLQILLKQIEDETPFVTVKHLSSRKLEQSTLVLPPLAEQQRIADILSRADRLRRLRRFALEMSAGYLQAVFLEMFWTNADPRWSERKIEELAANTRNSMRTGPFGSQLLHSEFVESGIAVLGIDNAVNNRFEWSKPRFITESKYRQLNRYTAFPGDVLITIMGTNGRCAVVPKSIPTAINTKHLCCITLDQNKCLPDFLQWAFLTQPSVQHQLGVSERGAVMPGLNMGIIKELHFPLPPIALQKKFVEIVEKNSRLRAQQREALRQAEQLFQGLLQAAFRGELTPPQA